MFNAIGQARRDRIVNRNVRAIFALLLTLSPSGFGTETIILVSGKAAVIATDGEGINARTLETATRQKTVVLQDRLIVTTAGFGRISENHPPHRVLYLFEDWIKTLPIKRTASAQDVAELIQKRCEPIFRKDWEERKKAGKVEPLNLSHRPDLPWVQYAVAENEYLGPRIYTVKIMIDYAKQEMHSPELSELYPLLMQRTGRKNTFALYSAIKGRGVSQLLVSGSPIQLEYLPKYPKEVGAYVHDQVLDVDGLKRLAAIMLDLAIKTDPDKFSYPVTICSTDPTHKASCRTSNKKPD